MSLKVHEYNSKSPSKAIFKNLRCNSFGKKECQIKAMKFLLKLTKALKDLRQIFLKALRHWNCFEKIWITDLQFLIRKIFMIIALKSINIAQKILRKKSNKNLTKIFLSNILSLKVLLKLFLNNLWLLLRKSFENALQKVSKSAMTPKILWKIRRKKKRL